MRTRRHYGTKRTRAIIRINFDDRFKISKITENNDLRPAMSHIYFKDGYAFASDAHILARVPISELLGSVPEEEHIHLDGKLIHSVIYDQIVKYDKIEIKENGIRCTKLCLKENVFYEFKDQEGLVYPDAQKLLTELFSKPEVPISKISFNYKLLKKLGDAIRCELDHMILSFKDETSAIIVKPNNTNSKAIGIIMPYMISNP